MESKEAERSLLGILMVSEKSLPYTMSILKDKDFGEPQHKYIFDLAEALNIPYIIFYSSDFDVLRQRLFARGDTEEVLENAEKINLCFKLLAEQLSTKGYKNLHIINIAKESDQIEWFKTNIEGGV